MLLNVQRLLRPAKFTARSASRFRIHRQKNTSTISELQAAFRDPNSPYYIAPGTSGPASTDGLPGPLEAEVKYPFTVTTRRSGVVDTEETLQLAQSKLVEAGFDPGSFWTQRIVWGDHDSFQHVNNVHYVRFFESSRIQWLMSIGEALGGPEKAQAMIRAQGISLILKSIQVRFRRPVRFPDTLLVGYKLLPTLAADTDPAMFRVAASAYSLEQQAYAAHSVEELVWYDYDSLKKCDPGDHIRMLISDRAKSLERTAS